MAAAGTAAAAPAVPVDATPLVPPEAELLVEVEDEDEDEPGVDVDESEGAEEGVPAAGGSVGEDELPVAEDDDGDEADGADEVPAPVLTGADPVDVVVGEPDVVDGDDPCS